MIFEILTFFFRSDITLEQVSLGLKFNKDLKELRQGDTLPVTFKFGLGCKLVPAESPSSPLLFNSPTVNDDDVQPLLELREQQLKDEEEAMELRECQLKEREEALLKEQEEWKKWKEVEKEIKEDQEVMKHNWETLDEWKELLGRLQEEDEEEEKQQKELETQLKTITRRNTELNKECQEKEASIEHLQQSITQKDGHVKDQ